MKKVLLIIPKFFGYENEIARTLFVMGYYCDIIFENIDELSFTYRVFHRNFPVMASNLCCYYYKNKLKQVNYEIVFVIRGSSLTTEVMGIIKGYYPSAKYYMYQWDSVKNNSNVLAVSEYFDAVFTFDIEDCKKYGWRYRPLFYLYAGNRDKKRKYDICFIGSLHSQRVKVFNYLKEKQQDKKQFCYLFSKRGHFIKQKYLKKNKDFIDVNNTDIKFYSLSLKQVYNVLSNTNIVVDYTHPGQTGFTMRTIESVGNRCKLVTNNHMIYDADFYNPQNIFVYDVENITIPNEFFESQFVELRESVFDRYSIKSWLQEILEL